MKFGEAAVHGGEFSFVAFGESNEISIGDLTMANHSPVIDLAIIQIGVPKLMAGQIVNLPNDFDGLLWKWRNRFAEVMPD